MDTIWQPELVAGAGPKYKAVADSIRRAVADKTLPVGDKLPPVRDLAWKLGITPGTVARAYTILTDEGLLLAEVGRGTFVAPPAIDLRQDLWSHKADPEETDVVSLFSPRLPDMGQVAAIRQALATISQCPDEMMMNYPTRQTARGAREAVVEWLSDLPLGSFSERDVVLSHGGQNAILLVLQAIISGPKPVMLVEDLSYAGFRRAAEVLRVDVVGIEMDRHGALPQALEAAARQTGAQVFCTTPEVQNPTGGHTPMERRKELIDVCNRYDLQILEDDCYRIGSPHAPSYRALAPDRGWHVSSISKILTPALRIGYALAPQGKTPQLRRMAEYGYYGIAQPMAELTRLLLSDPETKQIAARIRARTGAYVEAAVNILGGFDLQWDLEVPFLWLHLPAGWRAASFCRAAEKEGVQIRSADEFALRDGRAPHAVRIAINGHVAFASFEAAMHRLRDLLDNPPEQISV